jgi:hypothetical protein
MFLNNLEKLNAKTPRREEKLDKEIRFSTFLNFFASLRLRVELLTFAEFCWDC